MIPIRIVTMLAVLSLASPGCGNAAPAPLDVAHQVRLRVASLEGSNVSIRGERLLQRRAVARFYAARESRAAWSGTDAREILTAIRGVARDGLTPADYHLEAIEGLVEGRKEGSNPELEGDLDILLSDAVAGMVDHIRYGRVRPVSLNPAWNVDPRSDAPPLDQTLTQIRGSRDVREAIERSRPNHFIYKGLVRELEHVRELEAKGGWERVPAGRAIQPGASDPRIPAVRARLAASGELRGGGGSGTRYDPGLVGAVKRFQERHRMEPDGILGPATVEAMNVSAAARAGQVRANLERARWVLPGLSDEFLLINIPAFKAYLIRGGRVTWEARTQVGDEGMRTPSFRASMQTVVFNPDWTVPRSILMDEVLDGMRNGNNTVAKQRLRVYDSRGRQVNPASVDWGVDPRKFAYTLRQPPGKGNALGRVKFLFPNPYSIYLHDTPNQHLFGTDLRMFSHGCIRIEKALDLAETVLKGQRGWGRNKILQTMETGRTQNVALERPLPVLIVYWTVSVGATGAMRYAEDVYALDRPLLAALNRPPGRV